MKQIRPILMMLCGLWLLYGCGADKGQMLQQLELLEQMNRADSVMRNDSLAEDLVAYFDKHGTPNERMRARYILGRTYFDLGELPRSLETYLDAAGCADTTAADCDYKTLSRIHAQSAKVYHLQIQPESQLKELRLAQRYGQMGNDSVIAAECYSQMAGAYLFMHKYDSVIYISESASKSYLSMGLPQRSARKLGSAISSLLQKGDIKRAKTFIDTYEQQSGLFDDRGNIESGREVYYYTKGKYYLATGQVDSAEFFFRKELVDGKDLNNQIAGYKGLQEVYLKRGISDSIAKFSNLSYELNDSAYSLSEMQNIQKMQASYNYNYNKLLSEQNERRAEQATNMMICLICLFVLVAVISFFLINNHLKSKEQQLQRYIKDLDDLEKAQTELMSICSEETLSTSEIFEKKNREIKDILDRVVSHKQKVARLKDTLEERLNNSPVVSRLRRQAEANPYQRASQEDLKALRNLINVEIPQFYMSLNTPKYTLSPHEYDVTLLLRVHFSPMEIHKLTGISPSYISNMRSRLLFKIFGEEGSPKDFDQRIRSIK